MGQELGIDRMIKKDCPVCKGSGKTEIVTSKIKIEKPVILSNAEIMKRLPQLKKQIQEYIDYIDSDDYHEDNDWEYYIYESVIEIICGPKFWDWYNNGR